MVVKQADPFRSLDDAAVGTLLSSGLQKCHDAKSNMECAILDGDHTSDPRYYTAVLFTLPARATFSHTIPVFYLYSPLILCILYVL